MENINGFAVYGPTGSGKTSILRAFIYAASNFPGQHSDDLMDIELKLGTQEENMTIVRVNDCFLDTVKATEYATAELFELARVPRDRSDMRQMLSEFRHTGRMQDDKGANYDGMAQRTGDEESIVSVQKALDLAVGIVVVLDPLLVENGLMSRARYVTMVAALGGLSENPRGIKRRIAICVTKIDQLSDHSGFTAREYIDIKFHGMGDAIKRLEGRFDVNCFKVSNFGYLSNGRPNCVEVEENGKRIVTYIDKDSWRPHNVTQPFYWIFERIEQDLLLQMAKQRSRLIRWWEPTSEVLKKYIPYTNHA